MIIDSLTFEDLKRSVPDIPPETGGILGCSKNSIVDTFILDLPENNHTKYCMYTPNINYLNNRIEEWAKNGIQCVGFFHTHFANVKTLSKGDIIYINKIMKSLPLSMQRFYFPLLVLPCKELICYKAQYEQNTVSIFSDETIIQNNIL